MLIMDQFRVHLLPNIHTEACKCNTRCAHPCITDLFLQPCDVHIILNKSYQNTSKKKGISSDYHYIKNCETLESYKIFV